MQLVEIYSEGGFIMHPLLGCMILSLTIAIEKIITLKKFKKDTLLIKKAFESQNISSEMNEIISKPFQAINEFEQLGKNEVKSQCERFSQILRKKLNTATWMVGTVASSAPFIGLFGTVVGIIKSFASISKAGKGGFAIVAADLSEALIATAAGIIVAVIALILFNFIKQSINDAYDHYMFELEDAIEQFFLNKAK